MSVSVEMRSSSSHPHLRAFILHGIPAIEKTTEYQISQETERANIAQSASDNGFALGRFFLQQPSFSYVRARNINGAPCLDIMIGNGKVWTTGLEETAKKTIETALKASPVLVAPERLSTGFNLESFRKELSDFINNHPLQKTIKADTGSMSLKDFDLATRQATITSGGNCASQTTCKSSAGTVVSENILRNAICLNFPGIVRSVRFDR